jgi:hypothetical protein
LSISLGDIDNDGDLDLVAGNSGQTNRLYLNNGTADPFGDLQTGIEIGTDTDKTLSVQLGDLDGDGDLDLVTGNDTDVNRMYLNNGSDTLFSHITSGTVLGTQGATNTLSITLGDFNADGKPDIVAGNSGNINRLYLNNGTATPFSNATTGVAIGSGDSHGTRTVAAGDIDGDGDLDLVAGNTSSNNRYYLNNGTASPFVSIVNGTIIASADGYTTESVSLADVDHDGDLDMIAVD